MAREFDDLEFWLPSEFLTDDDLLTDFKADRLKTRGVDDFSYGFHNSFGLSSDLSSPSTETESDDDELISELTRKLAHSAIHGSNFASDYAAKGLKLAGSPQSTLCGCKPGSRGSPNSISGVCSPTGAEEQRRWDLLCAAAGEVARMRMMEEAVPFYSSKLYTPNVKPSTVTAPQGSPNPASPFYPNQQVRTQSRISYQMLQAAKFQQMKKQQVMTNGVYGHGFTEFQLQRNGGNGRSQSLSMSTRPTLQQPQHQLGSAMRAVFLAERGAKKERTGTGVFLPQRYGSVPSETRKKPASCSTVLLPEKVIHALNYGRDAIDAQAQNRSNGNWNANYDARLDHRNSFTMTQQRRSVGPQPAMNQQLLLPQDWTY